MHSYLAINLGFNDNDKRGYGGITNNCLIPITLHHIVIVAVVGMARSVASLHMITHTRHMSHVRAYLYGCAHCKY